MKRNRLRSIAALGVLWLCVSVGCRKDPPEIPCWEGLEDQFVKRMEGVPARYDGTVLLFNKPYVVINGVALSDAFVCPSQKEQVKAMNLKSNVIYDPKTDRFRLVDSTRAYPYRIWGNIYLNDLNWSILGLPNHGIRVEKIEEVK